MNQAFRHSRWLRFALALLFSLALLGSVTPWAGVAASAAGLPSGMSPNVATRLAGADTTPEHGTGPLYMSCQLRDQLVQSMLGKKARIESEAGHARVVFDSNVSVEDQELIGEAVRLSEDFFTTRLGTSLGDDVTVTALPISCPRSEDLIGAAVGDSIVFYTQSRGWLESPPAERVRIVLHEYTHAYQYSKTAEDSLESAAWFEEGLSEYLSLMAMSELGLIDRGEIEGLFGEIVQHTVLPPLEELERLQDFQKQPGQVYPLAYFGVAQLLDGRSLSSVEDYYRALQQGSTFPEAFEQVFGLTPEQFYDDFAEFRANELPTMGFYPAELSVSEGTDQPSPVTIEQSPASLVPGEQALVIADALPGANCTLSLIEDDRTIVIGDRDTFADGTGQAFWLMSIPPDLPSGQGDLVLRCGAEPLTVPVPIR